MFDRRHDRASGVDLRLERMPRGSLVPPSASMDTGHEVTIMSESADRLDPGESNAPDRFRTLPERIRLEDTITSQEAETPPDPTMGRDIERDFMLRYAGGG
jgi:hypothetical protein